MHKLRDGGTHPRPDDCPRQLYRRVMEPCWRAHPAARATFTHLIATLESVTGQEALAPARRVSRLDPAALKAAAAAGQKSPYEYVEAKTTAVAEVEQDMKELAAWRQRSESELACPGTPSTPGFGDSSRESIKFGFLSDLAPPTIAAARSNNPDTMTALKVAFKQLFTKLAGAQPSLVSHPSPDSPACSTDTSHSYLHRLRSGRA